MSREEAPLYRRASAAPSSGPWIRLDLARGSRTPSFRMSPRTKAGVTDRPRSSAIAWMPAIVETAKTKVSRVHDRVLELAGSLLTGRKSRIGLLNMKASMPANARESAAETDAPLEPALFASAGGAAGTAVPGRTSARSSSSCFGAATGTLAEDIDEFADGQGCCIAILCKPCLQIREGAAVGPSPEATTMTTRARLA